MRPTLPAVSALTLLSAFACAIRERTVSEAHDGAGASAGVGRVGTSGNSSVDGAAASSAGGALGSGGVAAGPADSTGGISGPGYPTGGAASAGAGAMPGCGGYLATPVQALSTWQYRRSVEDLTGHAVTTSFPAEPATAPVSNPVFRVAMQVSDLTVSQLFAEAMAQGDWASHQSALLYDCPYTPGSPCNDEAFVEQFMQHAFRRPLTDDETKRYTSLFLAPGNLNDGLALLVPAALLSPLFLFKINPLATDGPSLGRLDPYALAARVSLWLRGSAPPVGLWPRIANGEFTTNDRWLELVTSTGFVPGAQHFHAQWLGYAGLSRARADGAPELLAAFRAQTDAFVADVLGSREPSLSSLLTSTHVFVDTVLAPRYAVPPPDTAGFFQSQGMPGYAGLLTQAGTLWRYENPSQRGSFVRERLLCGDIPPPPAGHGNGGAFPLTPTERDAWAAHTTAEPTCASCHSLLDPLGFAFEHFDGTGLYRNSDNGLPIDASGSITGTDVDGAFMDLPGLASRLIGSMDVAKCYAGQWLSVALERPLTPGDACEIEELGRTFYDAKLDLPSLFVAIAESPAFGVGHVLSLANSPGVVTPPIGVPSSDTARRKLLLDFAIAESAWLTQILPNEDKPALDGYLSALRNLETQLSSAGGGLPPPTP